MHQTWSEFSREFANKHPDLYDRVLIKVKAKIEYEFEAHSDYSEEDLLHMISQQIGDGACFKCELEIIPPYSE